MPKASHTTRRKATSTMQMEIRTKKRKTSPNGEVIGETNGLIAE